MLLRQLSIEREYELASEVVCPEADALDTNGNAGFVSVVECAESEA